VGRLKSFLCNAVGFFSSAKARVGLPLFSRTILSHLCLFSSSIRRCLILLLSLALRTALPLSKWNISFSWMMPRSYSPSPHCQKIQTLFTSLNPASLSSPSFFLLFIQSLVVTSQLANFSIENVGISHSLLSDVKAVSCAQDAFFANQSPSFLPVPRDDIF